MKKMYLGLSVFAVLISAYAQAAGFEKSVMWSGKYAGTAGAAAVSGVSGSQGLFFNPAGLAGPGDASVNFSPTWISVKGNLASTNRTEETDKNFIPFGALTASYRLSERFGFGMGAYVAGGERAVYENVDLTGDAPAVTFTPKLQTDLAITEYALGAGMELVPGLRFGAAWRISKAKGSLSTLKKTVTNTAYIYSSIEDAAQTRYEGYRVGLQYEAPENYWGIGASYRNGVNFSATGNATGSVTVIPTNTTTSAVMSPVSLAITLPAQLAFGGHVSLTDKMRLFAGADWTQYSADQQVGVTGTITSAVLGGTLSLPNIPLNWKNMWSLRLGGEYSLADLALRAGYVYTNRVTSITDAKATLPPAGAGHLLTVGAGTSLMPNLDLDGALEYAWNSGNGSMSTTPAGSTTKELLADTATDTKAKSVGIHTGLTYRF